MIIVGYATKGNYEKELNYHLLPTIKKFNLKYDIEIIPESNWQKATHYKAGFLEKMLLKHKQDIVYLDVDAQILKHPDLFYKLNAYDIGLHYLDWELQWRYKSGERREALSGTLFLNYTENTLKFLDSWIEENKFSQQWEQKNMEKVLDESKSPLKIYKLPYSYITIIMHGDSLPLHMIKKEDIVILHHQASRRLKRR